MNSLLLIVDVQSGFVADEATKTIIPRINKLTRKWKDAGRPVAFSRFINKPDSPWVRYLGWNKLISSSETDLHPMLIQNYGETYDKCAYSAWSNEIAQICYAHDVESVMLCGIDTDQCVLATAIDIFDSGLKPILIKDCCASSAGEKFHDAGILLLERLIGKEQIVSSAELL